MNNTDKNFIKREDGIPLMINVFVYDLSKPDDDKPVQNFTWDYNNSDHRRRLSKLCIWAWTNNHSVETEAERHETN